MSHFMSAFLTRTLAIRTSNVDTQRRGRLLGILLLSTVVLIGALTAINLIETVRQFFVLPEVLWDICYMSLMIGLLMLNRSGHTRVAAIGFLGLLIGGCTLFFDIDEIDRVLLIYSIPILASSFIVSPVSSFIFAFVSGLGYTLVYLTGPGLHAYNYVSVLGLAMMATVAWLAATGVEQALGDARQSLAREQTAQDQLRAEIIERKQTEAALQTTQERLQAVVAAAPIFLFATDPVGVVTLFTGKALATMMRGDPNQFVGRSVFDTRYPIPGPLRVDIRRALAGETFTNTIETAGLAFEMWYSSHRDEHGRVTDVIGVATNVTQRKALEDMWKRYAFIANTSREFMTLINRQRVYEAVNDAYCHAQNKTREQILGKKVADVWGEDRYMTQVETNLDQCFAGQEVHFQAWFEFAALGVRYLEVAYYPYCEHGITTHVVVVSRDATERWRTEEALNHERRLLRTVIDNVPDQIFARDTDCRFILNNRSDAQAMGVPDPEMLLGMRDDDFYPPELAARYQADNRHVMDTGQPLINCEEPVAALAGGGQRWVLTTKVPLRDGQGQVIGVVGIARDITERKRVEEALQASEQRYRTLVETSPDPIALLDLSGTFIMANRRAVELQRFSSVEEMIGTDAFALIAPEDRLRAREAVLKTLQTGQARDGAYTMLCKDGVRFSAELSASTVADAAGQPQAFIVIARDISERRRVEEALRESEERYRALVETSPDAITLTDLSGRFIMANRRAAEVHRFTTAEEMIGINAFDLIAHEDWQRAGDDVGKAMESGRARNLEYTFLRKDGTRFPVEVSASRVVDATGKPKALMGVTRDITERKRAEEALRTAHAQNQQLLASISSILIGVSPDDRVTHWNAPAEAAFGLAAARVIGRSLIECDIPWDCAEVTRRISTSRSENRPTHLSGIRYTRPDGKDGYLNITLSPYLGDEHGQPGFLLLAEEITERKILEMQLAQAQKLEAIGQLAAGIAHEINTPIQYVGDNTRFLQESFFDILSLLDKYRGLRTALTAGEAGVDHLVEIERAEAEADVTYLSQEIPKAVYESLGGIARVAEIVRAMREFSHPGAEEKLPTDINKAIENTITVTRNEWKYVADVRTDLDPNLPRVPCLPGEFNQVILNLLVNAAQAIADVVGDGSNGKGTITVTTRHVGSRAEITIRDTGTGIPEAARGRIFDPFFTTKEIGKGTGQGLAIAYHAIVEKHKGTITFETESGKGTAFMIRLPMAGDSNEHDGMISGPDATDAG